MNALLNVGGIVATVLPLFSLMKKQPDSATQTAVTLGVGGNPNSGGNIPHIAVFDSHGNRIIQFKGNRKEHIGDKSGNDKTFVGTNNQNGGVPAKPEYVHIVMHENDGICLAMVVAANSATQWSWTGDMGYTCGAQWYASKYTVGNSNQPIRCVWLDANHDNDITAKGLSLHTRDFSGEAGMLAQYKENEARLCQSSARMTFYPETLPDAIPQFFNPPLDYMRETNDGDPTKPYTAGALEKPDQGIDRKTRAYPDGTKLSWRKVRRRQDIHGRRSIKRRGIKNLYPDILTVSHLQRHSAKELCESEMSLGPDFVSKSEGLFCGMETAKLWPLCCDTVRSECFDLEVQQIRANHTKRDDVLVKTYSFTDEWK